MFKNTLFLMLLCSGLAACVRRHYVELYKDDKGNQIYRASCKTDITNCYQIANEVCEKGFIPMEWYGKRSYTHLDDPQTLKKVQNSDTDKFGIGKGRMVFKCK